MRAQQTESLTQPQCPKCRTPMRWYRASLWQQEPRELLHFYSCEACAVIGRVAQIEGKASSQPTYFSEQNAFGARSSRAPRTKRRPS